MSSIVRTSVNEEYAYSEIVEAGDFVFLSFCVGNVGASIEDQVHGALNDMEKFFKEFAHIGGPDGLHVQIDAIAYKK